MSYHKSNNSGPNLTGNLEIVANRIFIIEDNQPVDLTNLFFLMLQMLAIPHTPKQK